MGKPETAGPLSLEISDVSGQKVVEVANAPGDSTVGELVSELVGKMNLPRNDPGGAPLSYQARLEREGRHLHSSELVGSVLESGDRLTLQPNIDAGSGR